MKGARRAGWGAGGGCSKLCSGRRRWTGERGRPHGHGGGTRWGSEPATHLGADPGDRRSKGLRRDRPGMSHSSEASSGAREGGAEREGGTGAGGRSRGACGPGQAPASDRQDRRRQGAAWGSGEMGLTPQKLPWAAEACAVEPPVAQATRGDGGRGRPGSTEATGGRRGGGSVTANTTKGRGRRGGPGEERTGPARGHVTPSCVSLPKATSRGPTSCTQPAAHPNGAAWFPALRALSPPDCTSLCRSSEPVLGHRPSAPSGRQTALTEGVFE